MAVQVSCTCGRLLNLADSLRGKKIRCPECSAVIAVPTADTAPDGGRRSSQSSVSAPRASRPASDSPRPVQKPGKPAKPHKRPSKPAPEPIPDDYGDESSWLDDLPPAAWDEPALPNRSSAAAKPTKARAKKSGKSPLIPVVITGGVIIGLVVVFAVGSAVLRSIRTGGTGGLTGSDNAGIPDLASVKITQTIFPPRPTFQPAFPSGVQLGRARLTGMGPGEQTQMNVYLPAGEHAERSLGCVLVAPAGTNLLIGNSLDGDDYHDETLPYAEAGFVTIQYSLDGPLADMESASDSAMAEAYKQFKAAGAGILNTRFVIEFVKARIPEVDVSRIYTAGHSSAGTVSLLAAEYLPEVAACIAYAPCSDAEAFHEEIRGVQGIDQLLPGIAEFDRQFSPAANVQKLKCPLFVFQARDDSVVEASGTQRFFGLAKQHNPQVEYVEVDNGEHYDSMIRQGIPRAIQWLKVTDAARSGEARSGTKN